MHIGPLAYAVALAISLTPTSLLKGAQSINLGTGLDASNNLITTGGLADNNWSVDAQAGGAQPTQVVTPASADWWGLWPANGPGSDWIARSAATTANGPAPYSFYRAFDLSAYDLSTVTIAGSWAIDDEGTLSLNGHQLGFHVWDEWGHGLETFSVPIGSPYLLQGVNTLAITETRNDNFYEGVRLEGTVSGSVPEPASAALLMLNTVLFIRRRR